MPLIELTTAIKAPIEVVFDLARSIDLHSESTSHTQEKAIDGRTSGLIELGETVRWRARHFGVWFELESKITDFERPFSFTDQMIDGPFKYIRHTHDFNKKGDITVMTDHFDFASPFGLLGKTVDTIVLRRYMENFLLRRNAYIKKIAESSHLN